MAFRGHYEHSLDAKNRLSIPARFRGPFSSGVVLSRDADTCVAIWTPDAFEAEVESALAGYNPLSRARKRIARYMNANSFDLELDSAGRVTVPGPLLEHARIEREVVVAGVGDHLELWSRDAWPASNADNIDDVLDALDDPS